MKTPWIKSCDSNSERPFDSAQSSAQQPATMETETLRLLRELEVHQLELISQNAELQRLNEQAEFEAKKYLELYDSSPSGYFTLSIEGEILDLNLAGAEMLGKNRSDLKNSKLVFFITLVTRPIFNLFFKNIFNSPVKENCEVILKSKGNKQFDVSLTGIVKADGVHCFVTMVDISERTRAFELLIANKELLYQNDENAKHAAELAAANKLIYNQKNRLEEIASLVPGVVYQYRLRPDGSSCFPFASEAIEQIYRVTSDEVREDASKVFEKLHPDDYDAVVSSIQTSAKHLSLWQHEYRVKFGDGTIRTLYGNAMPRLEADGSVLWHGFITDITERKIAQESLSKSESRYSSMISNISDVIGIMGADGLMTYKSANIEKFFGWLPEERIGTSGFATVHPDDIPDVQKVFYSLLGKENSVKTFEFRYQCKDGSYKPIELTASNQMFNPAINGVLVNYRDISDRKAIEANLEESREKYRGLSEASFESIFLSEKGVCIEQNLAAELMFGYTTEEALTRYGTDWIVPENREMVMKNMISGYQEPYEATALRKDGSTFPCVLLGRMMQYKGKDVRVTSLTDISIRKKIEAELKLISTRLSLATFAGGIGIWDYDVVNNTLLWDDQMFTLYGIEERDFSGVYEAWRAGLHPDDVEQGDLEIQMAINGVKEFDTEFRVIWPDHSVHSIKATAIVKRDESGKTLHMVGTNWDITEQKNAEAELSKARNEAEFSNKAKSQFLANMSHEIRTPLNSIIGFSQLMNRQNLTEIQQEYSNSIHRSGEHLLILLNDILELSKIEAGQMELIQTRVDLTVLFSDLQLMFNQLARSKQLKLIFERGDEFSQYLLVDETKIRQILINLISNAIKFTVAGSVVVRARVSKTTDQKLLLVMEVQDSGPGIPESDLERIFNQFEQAKAGIKQGIGTGLGLALSRELAILMGGNITVASEVGKGSVFTFRLEVVEGKPEYAMEEIKGRVIGMINPQQVYRILVVDDNEVNIALMVNFLQLAGFETGMAVNGEDAIAKFEQWSPHLILMDLTMPVMDGYEATHRIKSTEQGKRTPVIAVTANQYKDNMAYARQLDFQGYIKKPFREDELFGVIGEILGITYIYEQEKGAAQLSRYINNPEALAEDVAKLPANNVVQMQEALEKADFYLLIELTRKIDATNPELAQYLRAQANNFDSDNFLKILKNNK